MEPMMGAHSRRRRQTLLSRPGCVHFTAFFTQHPRCGSSNSRGHPPSWKWPFRSLTTAPIRAVYCTKADSRRLSNGVKLLHSQPCDIRSKVEINIESGRLLRGPRRRAFSGSQRRWVVAVGPGSYRQRQRNSFAGRRHAQTRTEDRLARGDRKRWLQGELSCCRGHPWTRSSWKGKKS